MPKKTIKTNVKKVKALPKKRKTTTTKKVVKKKPASRLNEKARDYVIIDPRSKKIILEAHFVNLTK